ncbi:amyloid -binding 2-like isoform X1 [Brachionus plicatilis]|uniref:Amyloid-binding 2-like isoform X1 n=1 Tax=Brachionus plicatilis TaxID=10195 RepID=A0A3M7SYZ5_BRAPC|nr:amyloid -binding 2-like isoform X1 [Brachionus plicatilis]
MGYQATSCFPSKFSFKYGLSVINLKYLVNRETFDATMGENYNIDEANLNRLKTNRINIIQTLEVNDDLVSELVKQKIIDYQRASEIMCEKGRQNKAKGLLDSLLHTKREELRKDWYIRFREVLLDRNYSNLVTFLDNTIIKKPKFVEKISSLSTNSAQELKSSQVFMQPESESDYSPASNPNSNLVRSLLVRPEYLFEQLKASKDLDDLSQLDIELDVFYFVKNLEGLYLMLKAKEEQYKDTFLLDTADCKNVLNLSSSFMVIKYFRALGKHFNIDLLKFMTESLIGYFNQAKVIRLSYYDCLDELVFKLCWTLVRNERNELADQMLSEYLNHLEFLDTYVNKINAENNSISAKNKTQPIYNSKELVLTSKFYAYSNHIIVKANLFDFESCWIMLDKAQEILNLCLISWIFFFSTLVLL